jgi:hypothetical protein
MKYILLIALSLIPLSARSDGAKTIELPAKVQAVMDSRLKITIEFEGKKYILLIPVDQEKGIEKLRFAMQEAGIEPVDEKTRKRAVGNGGHHAVTSCFMGKYILVPLK